MADPIWTAEDIAAQFEGVGADPTWNTGKAKLVDGQWTYTGSGATAGATRMQDIADRINDPNSGYTSQDLQNSLSHILRSGGSLNYTTGGTDTVPPPEQQAPRITEMSAAEEKHLLAEIRASYPWAFDIGFGDEIIALLKEGATVDQIVAMVRQSDGWAEMFPGFYRSDGSKNYTNEALYLQAVADYRNVLKDFGAYDEGQDNPQNYVGWMELQIDPNELEQRFQMYRGLERGSQELRDAFYVYGGMRVSVDDLYSAVVDPSMADQMQSEYDQAAASTALDYETFLSRATEVATERLTETMGWLEANGYAPQSAVQNVVGTDPNQVRQFLDIIYTAGTLPPGVSPQPGTMPEVDWDELHAGSTGEAPSVPLRGSTGGMSLNELITTYTYAMLGSAATEQGLVLPTQEKLERYVQAGVTRSRAMQAYGAYSVAQYGLAGMASRANIQNIDQNLFEEAVLLHQGDAADIMSKATGYEESLGRAGGGFNTQLDDRGNLVQRGRR